MKRKNKPIRRPDAVQPLPLPADADEIAFAHGVSRRVVVVDAAESPLFEQIIYIVRDDAASGGVTAADLVQQARDAVGCVPAPAPRPLYMKPNSSPKPRPGAPWPMPPPWGPRL